MEKTVGIVVDYNDDGDGVVKLDGKVFFVKGALLGEEVEFEVLKNSSKFAFCKTIKVLKRSEDRVESPCPYFLECGGCDFLNLKKEKQLEFKEKKAEKALNSNVESICALNEMRYRNKITLFVDNLKCGLKKTKSNDVVEISDCLISDEKIKKYVFAINKYLAETHDINIQGVVIKFNKNGDIIIFQSAKDNFKQKEFLVEKLKEQNLEFSLFVETNNSDKNIKHVYGLKETIENVNGINYTISSKGFMQINNEIRDELYRQVVSNVNTKMVVNAYSGAGLLSGILAKNCEKCFGIELNYNSHIDAEKLKTENKLSNLINILGDCAKELPKVLRSISTDASVVVDPPRSGCTKSVLDAILKQKNISKVIYISCNIATLKRDLELLNAGFKTSFVRPFDMFPQTCHVEMLAVLERKN